MPSSIVGASLAVLSAAALVSALPQPQDAPKADAPADPKADKQFDCTKEYGVNPDDSDPNTALLRYVAKAKVGKDWEKAQGDNQGDSLLFICVPKEEKGKGYDLQVSRTFCDQDKKGAYDIGPWDTGLAGSIKIHNGAGCDDATTNLNKLAISYFDAYFLSEFDVPDAKTTELLRAEQTITCDDKKCMASVGECTDFQGKGAICPFKISGKNPDRNRTGREIST